MPRSLPFVRMFHGSPSEYLWEDDFGETHSIPQGVKPFLVQGGHRLCVIRQVEFGVVFVCSSLRREMPRRGWQTVEVPAVWFKEIPSRRVGPRQGAKVQFVHNQIAAQVVSPGVMLQALRQAQRHAQVQPVESRINSSEFFIDRAKKRVENARKEMEDAKAKVVAAEMR